MTINMKIYGKNLLQNKSSTAKEYKVFMKRSKLIENEYIEKYNNSLSKKNS